MYLSRNYAYRCKVLQGLSSLQSVTWAISISLALISFLYGILVLNGTIHYSAPKQHTVRNISERAVCGTLDFHKTCPDSCEETDTWREEMKRLMNKGEECVSYSAAFEWCQRLQKEVRGTGWMQPGWGEAGALETDWSLLKQNAVCRHGKCVAQRLHYN